MCRTAFMVDFWGDSSSPIPPPLTNPGVHIHPNCHTSDTPQTRTYQGVPVHITPPQARPVRTWTNTSHWYIDPITHTYTHTHILIHAHAYTCVHRPSSDEHRCTRMSAHGQTRTQWCAVEPGPRTGTHQYEQGHTGTQWYAPGQARHPGELGALGTQVPVRRVRVCTLVHRSSHKRAQTSTNEHRCAQIHTSTQDTCMCK